MRAWIFIGLMLLPSGLPGPKQSDPPQEHQQVGKQTPAPAPSVRSAPHWYASPEWWLVIFAFPTLCFLAWQSSETRKAAKAASKSADALINAERAWVIAELVPICVQFGKWWHRRAGNGWATLSEEEVLNGDHLKHKLKLTNMGRTPAHILSFQIGYSCLSEGITDLPKGTPGDTVEFRPFDHLLAAGGSVEVLEPIIDVDRYIKSSNSIEVIRAIEEFKSTAVFHGWVRYQHVFSSNDVIKEPFCYSYSPQNMRLNRVVRPKAKQPNENRPN